jgi:hypothetical protein
MDPPLEDLISLNEKLDRLREVLSLVQRAKDKFEGAVKPRIIDKSPLSAFKFLKGTIKMVLKYSSRNLAEQTNLEGFPQNSVDFH